MLFKLWLIQLGINPDQYYGIVCGKAFNNLLNMPVLSDDENYKFFMVTNAGNIYFGKNYEYDYVIYFLLEQAGKYDAFFADQMNNEWILKNIMPLNGYHNMFSPLMLEYYLLWN